MGIIGLGIVCVMGRTRVPLPAARIIAFILINAHQRCIEYVKNLPRRWAAWAYRRKEALLWSNGSEEVLKIEC